MRIHEWSGEDTRLGETYATQLRTASAEYAALYAALGIDDMAAAAVAAESRDALAEWAPDLRDEAACIADGAGMPELDVVALGARTEILASVPPTGDGECSTAVLLPEDGSATRTFQTWDWHDRLSNEVLVRHLRADGRIAAVTFCEFGQPAKIGVNAAGLGVHFNILNHRSDGGRGGVPVHALARRVLDSAETIGDALEIVRSARVSASSVLTVVTPSAAASIEVSPHGIAVIPAETGVPLLHTNHFLDAELAQGESTPHFVSTYRRLSCLTDRSRALSDPDALGRVRSFAADDGGGDVGVRPRPEAPIELSWATKAVLTLDTAAPALEYCAGGPGAATSESWRRTAV